MHIQSSTSTNLLAVANTLNRLGMTDEFIERRQQQKEAHFVSEMYNERKWRNQQLRDALYLLSLIHI